MHNFTAEETRPWKGWYRLNLRHPVSGAARVHDARQPWLADAAPSSLRASLPPTPPCLRPILYFHLSPKSHTPELAARPSFASIYRAPAAW